MFNVKHEKELWVQAPNKVGTAFDLTKPFKDSKTNIKHIRGEALGSNTKFGLITDDNKKAQELLKKANFSKFEERDVLVAHVSEHLGAVNELTEKCKNANLDFDFLSTTIFDNKPAIVFSTNDNQKAAQLFC